MSEKMTIDSFVAAVAEGLADLPARDRKDALAELESLLSDEAVRRGEGAAVASLGDPAEYACQVRAALRDGDAPRDPAEPQGRILGMPYDFRGASVERVGARLWNPSDPRILMPRLFGLGWTVNFGAIAVKLGMIRPDDFGDEAFDRIPKAAANVALAVPVLLATATLVLFAVNWSILPAEVPMHWNAAGHVDDRAAKPLALGLLVLLGVVPVYASLVSLLLRRATARARMLSAAVLALLASLALGIGAVTVADARGGAHGNLLWIVILGSAVLPFVLLYVPSRLGLRAEWREASAHKK